jgi:peroxiredoxin
MNRSPARLEDSPMTILLRDARHAPWLLLTLAGGLIGAFWLVGAARTTPPAPAPPAAAHVEDRHPVTPGQLADANAMIEQRVGDFNAAAHDGRRMDWHELSGGQGVVLIFIKQGCPCNAEVEPFFQRIERLYLGEVRFASIIDAGLAPAARYAAEQRVLHPVLADPERRLIERFGARNGCYVVLLTPAGVIDGCWPGCSAETMQHLGVRIARLAGIDERPLDVTGMPTSLTTGCPFPGRAAEVAR